MGSEAGLSPESVHTVAMPSQPALGPPKKRRLDVCKPLLRLSLPSPRVPETPSETRIAESLLLHPPAPTSPTAGAYLEASWLGNLRCVPITQSRSGTGSKTASAQHSGNKLSKHSISGFPMFGATKPRATATESVL